MRRLLTVLVLMALMSPSVGFGQEEMVNLVALGRAPLDKSEATAKKQAVDDALSRAVAQVAMQMVDPATLSAKLDVLERAIISQAPRFITNYSHQSSGKSDKAVLALVKVSVNKSALNRALASAGLRILAERLPETLVLVSEETSPGRPPVFWWSGQPGVPPVPLPVAQVLKSQGLPVMQAAGLKEQIGSEMRIATLSTAQGLELARSFGAGMLLMGRVRTYPLLSQPGSEPQPVAQLIMLDVAQGTVMAMEEARGPVYTQTPGPQAAREVTQAVETAVRRLLEKVVSFSPELETGGSELLLEITGVRSLADTMRFEQALMGLTAMVESFSQEKIGAGWASYRLKLKVPASQLADKLLTQNMGNYLLQVLELSPEKMKVEIIPR